MSITHSHNAKLKSKVGDCEAGTFCNNAVNVEIFPTDFNMWLCSACLTEQNKLIERERLAKELQASFTKTSESVQLVTDIHNAATVPMFQLRAAIDNDPSIPEDMKDYVYAKKCEEHMLHFRQVAFEERKKVTEAENAAVAWQVNCQSAVGKLRSDLQGEFKLQRIDYKPITPKSVKSNKSGPSKSDSQKVSAVKAKEVAAKYGLEAFHVKMVAESRKLSVEEAARFLAIQLGKIPAPSQSN